MAIVSTLPVKFKYNHGPGVDTENNVFTSLDGVFFTLTPLLSGAKDATFNQDTLSILSSNLSLANCLSATPVIEDAKFTTTSTLNGGGNYLVAGLTAGSVINFTADKNNATVFNFEFNTDKNEVSLSCNNNYVTIDGTSVVKMQPYSNSDFTTKQTFNYNLYNEKLCLFTKTYPSLTLNFFSVVSLELASFTGFNDTTNVLIAARFARTNYSDIGESNNVKYNKPSNDINVRLTTDKLPYNYFLTAPYQTITTEDVIDYNITPLKNYYSPEHLLSPTLSAQSRSYNKLYTGLNTEKGNDKIYLSYQGHEVLKTFTKDKDTYFHYSVSAFNVALSASTLVKAGSLPGSSPWRSDRLFVKQADYRAYSNWGNHPGLENGTFFCSWLSASEVGAEPVWMDRYFDSTRINLTQVLSSEGVGSSNNNYPNVIWDVPTTQIFSPESLYIYHRIGDQDNTLVVDTLSSMLTHYIKEWSDPLINNVTGLSAGNIYNLSPGSIQTYTGTNIPALNTSTSYAILDLNNEDFYSPGFTLAFQAYNNNWSNIQGDQIIGNYYDGGVGMFKENALLTPFITVIGDNVKTFNTNLEELANTTSSLLSGNSFVLKGAYDESYFVVDVYKNVYEYDQDGTLTTAFSLNYAGILKGAQLIQEEGIRRILLVLLNGTTIYWYKLNTDGSLHLNGSIIQSNNYALCNTPTVNTVLGYSATGNSTIDSKNTVFTLSGDVLVKGLETMSPSYILSARQAEYIACDHEDNIWVLYSGNSVCKLNNYGAVIWDVNLTQDPIRPTGVEQVRIINFTAELDTATGTTIYYGLILDGKTQNIFKINPSTGAVVKTYRTTPVYSNGNTLNTKLNCRPAGDSTGYDYQRKYILPNTVSTNLKFKALVGKVFSAKATSTIKEITYDASNLTPGWHHFAISLDQLNNFKLYIDGLSAASTQVGDLSAIYKIYNKRNNPDLVIGTSSFKTVDLAQFTKQTADPYSYNGAIADVRFYSSALAQADIKAIYKSFYVDSFTDLKWASEAGSRYYIEQIDRLFPHRQPGAKSQFFNIKIKNSNITDSNLQSIIEKNLIASLSKSTPVYTKLNKIIWE